MLEELHQGSPFGELNWRRKQALVSPGEGEWRSKRDTGQFFPPLTCYPTHGKKLAQRRDCRISRRCSVSPSPQLYRCLPERRRAPTHRRRQHSVWSEPSPPWGTARLGIGTPRRWHPLSSGPTSAWRQPSLSADHRNRQGAAQSFWSSGCGPRICAMLLRDTATPRLGCLQVHHLIAEGRGGNLGHVSRPGSQDNVRVVRPEHKALFAHRKCLEVPDPFDGSERGQERCLSRQVFQLDWVQRLKGSPLKSNQDDREVPGGHQGWPRGVQSPGTPQEPHDEIMLSQGPAVHCIVMGRDSGHIHFQGGGWQPTLQPFLQEGKHYSNRASSWVFSARRTPVREQTPLQCIGLPCRRSSSLSDGLYHRLWETTQVCRVPSRSHTWRFHRSGRGCQMVPSPWERRSFLRGMGQGGAVARRMSSGNQVRVGQNGATSRTCSSSSLTLHSVCASRLTGGNAYLHRARGQLCASASWHTAGSGRTRGKQTGLPELPRIDSRSAGSSRDGVAILRGSELSWERIGRTIELPRNVDSAQRFEPRVTPEEEMAGELWHAAWSYTPHPVDVRHSRSVVRTDQHMLA